MNCSDCLFQVATYSLHMQYMQYQQQANTYQKEQTLAVAKIK